MRDKRFDGLTRENGIGGGIADLKAEERCLKREVESFGLMLALPPDGEGLAGVGEGEALEEAVEGEEDGEDLAGLVGMLVELFAIALEGAAGAVRGGEGLGGRDDMIHVEAIFDVVDGAHALEEEEAGLDGLLGLAE